MKLDDRLQHVAVLGAGGKMGRGISLLLAREMTLQQLKAENQGKTYRLILVDVHPPALEGLKEYLIAQAKKFALKNIPALRPAFPDVSEEETLAERFGETLLSLIHPTTDLPEVTGSHLVFEAILEKIDLKVSVYRRLRDICSEDTFFFSNTSSIPIHVLDEQAGLDGRLIGFHFYNPPAVQKLVELIIPEKVHPELPELARELGQRLGKIIIPSNDVAGFIGNGHFMRDGLHGIAEAERLQSEMSFVQAIYTVNRITQEFLIRPMGIFQLIDYVGLDIFQSILAIMNPHFPEENLHSELIDTLVEKGIKGGQYPDGSQKDGFLKYEGGKPAGVYDLESGQYVGFDEGGWRAEADEKIGPLPEGHAPWKALVKAPQRENALANYFRNLKAMDTFGARLALRYLRRSKEIGQQLVATGVANSAEDVNGVLMNGFFHLYGPINDYVD